MSITATSDLTLGPLEDINIFEQVTAGTPTHIAEAGGLVADCHTTSCAVEVPPGDVPAVFTADVGWSAPSPTAATPSSLPA